MKIGIVGYRGAGKSTLFELLTGEKPDPAQAHVGQSAMAEVPEPRLEKLHALYKAKKVTKARLELVDTPGLTRDHEGNAARLGVLRDSGALVLVVAGFAGSDPLVDLASFAEDLLFADLEIVMKRVEKLRESSKKPTKNREAELAELEALEPLLKVLESGQSLRTVTLDEEQLRATRSFRLFTEKSMMVVVNLADDDTDAERFTSKSTVEVPIVAAPLGLEVELSKMDAADRKAFEEEMGVSAANRDGLLKKILDVSGQMVFLTAGEKEVRTWMVQRGGTALDAAAAIHTDLAKSFARAQVMNCDDLLRLGSEREVKAHNLMRIEQKTYLLQDGDVLVIL